MKITNLNAELIVLDRIKHLLEEGSVEYLVTDDTNFAFFIDRLYNTVEDEAVQLRKKDLVRVN
jgi:hypothetical protein